MLAFSKSASTFPPSEKSNTFTAIWCDCVNPLLSPNTLNPASLKAELPQLPNVESGLDVIGHSRNFFDCIKSRKPTAANEVVMRHSHIACHAAALSWMLGRTLELDPVKEEFVNDMEANRLRSRPARDGRPSDY